MLPYIITLVIYLLSQEASYIITGDRTISIAAKLILTTASIIYFMKDFKFRPRFDALAIASGILIAVIWIAIDPFYPHIGSAVVDMVPFTAAELILRLINSIILASIVEEFFTRFLFTG